MAQKEMAKEDDLQILDESKDKFKETDNST